LIYIINLSKKPLYILTENLNFFYRVKKELDRNNIQYKVLNIGGKIPSYSSIILSTLEEMNYLHDEKNDIVILPYFKTQNFDQYILQVIAACRVGFKNYYSSLSFSIDPGTKYIGVATFIDDYYLESHTIYTKEDTVAYIIEISNLLRLNDSKPLDLYFKFGRGVLGLSFEIIQELFSKLNKQSIKKVYLIDEISTSKIRLVFNNKKVPKHESAAIQLALREGLEINEANFDQIFKRVKNNQIKNFAVKNDYISRFKDQKIDIKLIAEKIINGNLSLNEGMNIINGNLME
jgi:hypothetical protein